MSSFQFYLKIIMNVANLESSIITTRMSREQSP